MKRYNSLTRKKEAFIPLNPGKVSMYVCGPTVYNYFHIGNGRTFIVFDTIRRYMEYRGYEVNFVQNFTDIDDKMINKANEENTTVKEIGDKYISEYYKDADGLNIKRATTNPRATEYINEIIEFVSGLIEKGYAYEVNGDVYFRTKKFEGYGQLIGQNLDDLQAGARINVDERKEDPMDFAIWKAQKPGEPAWECPWGLGRPGWHIECSCMAKKLLGDTIDIHAGGMDLAFPHHENEIAQSEAKTGKKFVNYWLHNGFVTVGKDQEKMSKSLHNFVTVHDILKEVDPQVLRFFMASVQYRRQINYSEENLKQAATILDRFKNTLTNINYRLEDDTASEAVPDLAKAIEETEQKFVTAMDDDFNVQNALTAIYDLLPAVNANANSEKADKETLTLFEKKLAAWLLVFGVDTEKLCAQNAGSNDDEIEELVKKRDEARANKDWATSDKLRDQLKEMGITIQDTPQGTRWTRD